MKELIENKVSIIMASYNTAQFITETIQSVINQTYSDWELIIVDDCSTDDTEKIVSSFDDPRIYFYKNSSNRGAAVSRNRAIKLAIGEYIAILDSDDVWLPEKLEKQVSFMKKNNYSFCCSYSSNIDEDSNYLGFIDMCPRKITKMLLHMYDWIPSLTGIYNAKVVGEIQIADIRKRNDYALYLKVVEKAECFCYPEVLAAYRIRKKSLSHSGKLNLIKYFYQMYRKCMGYSVIMSGLNTVFNVVFSFVRKALYMKKTTYEDGKYRL